MNTSVFSNVVTDIKNRIDMVQSVPDDSVINSEDVIKRVEQTGLTTQELADTVGQNKKNAVAIQEIVERFSEYSQNL